MRCRLETVGIYLWIDNDYVFLYRLFEVPIDCRTLERQRHALTFVTDPEAQPGTVMLAARGALTLIGRYIL